MTWFIRALRALDDHWLGDLLAAASLFVCLWIGLLAGAVQGASGVIVDGMRYCLVRDTGLPVVVTVRKAGAPDIRTGHKATRKPARRPLGRGPGA